ncbi:TIGR03790 family protein [bacterium]|nr:MAG: TIGR03790 family protein [bacterium]
MPLLALALLACSPPAAQKAAAIVAVPMPESPNTLVVVNTNSRDSLAIGSYYAKRRGIPYANVVTVEVPDEEEIDRELYKAKIENVVQEATLSKNIDYIVTTKGVPIRIREGGYSVDAFLTTMSTDFLPLPGPDPEAIRRNINPFFGKKEAFSHNATRLYLTCRLDGYTVNDAKALVDRSIEAKPSDGPFLFDMADNRRDGGFGELQRSLPRAADLVKARGKTVTLDTEKPFIVPDGPLAGYVSWGSNDNAYKLDAYRRLKFQPGALVETFVSTSGRTFRPTTGGQSLIADLVAQGVTGVKGYVSEPYVFALARPEILFDRYLGGSNLAESFYAASPVVKWKDVVIGDPLCRPYRKL